ncbi:MAG: hypothetical protein P1V35_09840 [Planctomycetota bacterium]|nr:hypothetical protein [Planctomycetota bacterium]
MKNSRILPRSSNLSRRGLVTVSLVLVLGGLVAAADGSSGGDLIGAGLGEVCQWLEGGVAGVRGACEEVLAVLSDPLRFLHAFTGEIPTIEGR